MWVLLGNPENRRMAMFTEALKTFRQPEPTILSWEDFLKHQALPEPLPGKPCIFRMDSPGENHEVEKALLAQGEEEPDETGEPPRISRKMLDRLTFEPGRILFPRQWYLGFRKVLRTLDRFFSHRPDIRVVQQPADIISMFDKRICHALCRSRKAPVPDALGPVGSYDDVMERMRQTGIRRVFIKLAAGSSASGVIALETNFKRIQAFTSAEAVRTVQGFKLFNSLKIRRYRSHKEIKPIIDMICENGAHVERWTPKAGWKGRRCDLRILSIGGRPCHGVLRLGRSPMTNLHLGGRRGDMDDFLNHIGEARWAKIKTVCRKASSVFPRSLHVGVDLLLSPGFNQCRVAELNAFGDLLPHVLHRGLNSQESQVNRLLEERGRGWNEQTV